MSQLMPRFVIYTSLFLPCIFSKIYSCFSHLCHGCDSLQHGGRGREEQQQNFKVPLPSKYLLLTFASLGCLSFTAENLCAEFDTRRLFLHSSAKGRTVLISNLTLKACPNKLDFLTSQDVCSGQKHQLCPQINT